jgi:hypothetical protein
MTSHTFIETYLKIVEFAGKLELLHMEKLTQKNIDRKFVGSFVIERL